MANATSTPSVTGVEVSEDGKGDAVNVKMEREQVLILAFRQGNHVFYRYLRRP
jgi:hypothetical protein